MLLILLQTHTDNLWRNRGDSNRQHRNLPHGTLSLSCDVPLRVLTPQTSPAYLQFTLQWVTCWVTDELERIWKCSWHNWGTILEFAWRGQGKPWLEQQASWWKLTLSTSHIQGHSVATTATYLVHYSALLNVTGSFMRVYKTPQCSVMTWWRLKHVVGQGIHLKVIKHVVQFLGLGTA